MRRWSRTRRDPGRDDRGADRHRRAAGALSDAADAGAAVMTNSGAFKGFALDFGETIGLDLPELRERTAEAIRQVLPPFASIDNPLDMTAQTIKDATIFGRSAARLLADPAIGSLVVSIVPARRSRPWPRPTRCCRRSATRASRWRSRSWATIRRCPTSSPPHCARAACRSSARRNGRCARWRA